MGPAKSLRGILHDISSCEKKMQTGSDQYTITQKLYFQIFLHRRWKRCASLYKLLLGNTIRKWSLCGADKCMVSPLKQMPRRSHPNINKRDSLKTFLSSLVKMPSHYSRNITAETNKVYSGCAFSGRPLTRGDGKFWCAIENHFNGRLPGDWKQN